jgi:hypothetical protein
MNEINWNEKISILDDVDDMVEEFTKLFFRQLGNVFQRKL